MQTPKNSNTHAAWVQLDFPAIFRVISEACLILSRALVLRCLPLSTKQCKFTFQVMDKVSGLCDWLEKTPAKTWALMARAER